MNWSNEYNKSGWKRQININLKQINTQINESTKWNEARKKMRTKCLSLCCVVQICFHSKWHEYPIRMAIVLCVVCASVLCIFKHLLAEPTAFRYNYRPQFQCQLIYHHFRPLNIAPDIDLVGKWLCFDSIAYYILSAIRAHSLAITTHWKCSRLKLTECASERQCENEHWMLCIGDERTKWKI